MCGAVRFETTGDPLAVNHFRCYALDANPESVLGLGCVETLVQYRPTIFVIDRADKLGVGRLGTRNRF